MRLCVFARGLLSGLRRAAPFDAPLRSRPCFLTPRFAIHESANRSAHKPTPPMRMNIRGTVGHIA